MCILERIIDYQECFLLTFVIWIEFLTYAIFTTTNNNESVSSSKEKCKAPNIEMYSLLVVSTSHKYLNLISIDKNLLACIKFLLQ